MSSRRRPNRPPPLPRPKIHRQSRIGPFPPGCPSSATRISPSSVATSFINDPPLLNRFETISRPHDQRFPVPPKFFGTQGSSSPSMQYTAVLTDPHRGQSPMRILQPRLSHRAVGPSRTRIQQTPTDGASPRTCHVGIPTAIKYFTCISTVG